MNVNLAGVRCCTLPGIIAYSYSVTQNYEFIIGLHELFYFELYTGCAALWLVRQSLQTVASRGYDRSFTSVFQARGLLSQSLRSTETRLITLRALHISLAGPECVPHLYLHPTSKIARENFDVFSDMWQSLVNDVASISCDIAEMYLRENPRRPPEKPPEEQPEKLPTPTVSTSQTKPVKQVSITKPTKPAKVETEEKEKIEKVGLEMKSLTSEMDAETEKHLTEENDNDIVRRGRGMSQMAFSVYQFTRGEGELKTTQDLFTQAEIFAEEANKLYKDIRQFSYQVPGGPQKKELLENLDKVPTYVQQLQFTVRSPTVGKAATFTKVDNVIQGTKNLMNVVSKVVTTSLVCASKVSISLNRLENVTNFTEFVKAFSLIGTEMVELASVMGDRQHDVRDERRRSQMKVARQILLRSTTMLLTSAKACLRHPDCETVRENRDTVFLQMRRAIDLIHCVIKDGVIPDLVATYRGNTTPKRNGSNTSKQIKRSNTSVWQLKELEQYFTVHNAMKKFEELLERINKTFAVPAFREQLLSALEAVMERTQDFTDSAYTSHEHRENILILRERTKVEVNHLLKIGVEMDQAGSLSPTEDLEISIQHIMKACKDLKKQLQDTTLDHSDELFKVTNEVELMNRLKNAAVTGDRNKLGGYAEKFSEHVDHLQEVCKLLHHVAMTEALQVSSKHVDYCLKVYGAQVLNACHTLYLHPTSKIARENFDVFSDMWQSLVNDVASISCDIAEMYLRENPRRPPEKPPEEQPEKLPTPTVSTSQTKPVKQVSITKPTKPAKVETEEKEKIEKVGLEMKSLTSEMDAETEKHLTEENDNDIVRRGRGMSQMAFSVYQFTRGEGELKTTQDLFTQAEIFAEEANKLYKDIRQFSYQVPGGPQKKELLENLDKVPTYVQQLQFTVRSPTVGKAATFTKVDNVIQGTKNLMNVVSKVVTTSLVCASKFNLEFRGSSSWSRSASTYYGDPDECGYGDATGGMPQRGGGTSSSDPNI
ncbi:alpha-catulin-like [Tachypleus tridentatus]|uniref:alpha-catulin-like n=1 Tax=Tachypleus tridentatus TaxID=6853 RepID=UPI003FD231AD